jgi:hypothetical protein
MASGALDCKRRIIEIRQGFSDVLPSSRALRWLAPRTVLGATVASLGFTWLLSLPMWGLMWMD